jgi:hypothetical protein
MPAQHEADRQARQGLDAFKFFSAFYVTGSDSGSTFGQEAGQGRALPGQADDRRSLPSEIYQMAAT